MFELILAAGMFLSAPQSGGRDELRAAAAEVQRESNGKILSARTVNYGRQRMHRIKVLTDDGRVQVRNVPERPGPIRPGNSPRPGGQQPGSAPAANRRPDSSSGSTRSPRSPERPQ
jgi:hypothetical protein